MARQARVILSGVPQHIIQRGNNRRATFFVEEDYRCYLDRLLEAVKKYDRPLGGERFKDETELPAALL